MKYNKDDSRLRLGVPKGEFMKNSSFNFLENERNFLRSGYNKTDETPNRQFEVVEQQSRTTCLPDRTGVMNETLLTSTETRNEPGKHSPKRYVTTCYFQPKQNPVSYSETVILTLGSKKKHYFDTVMYQTQLVPMRWTESMTTVTAPEDEFEANYECFMEVPNYHYISLEPQQLVAQEKLTV